MTTPASASAPAALSVAARPLVSVLLIAYNQERVVADAVRSVLAQTYEPLEILISDDASSDQTFAAIEAAVQGYAGPHQLSIRRNTVNEGISGHLSRLAGMAQGELLFVAAGDDMSMPQRCERVVACWLAHDRRPDLIATDLADMDEHGVTHEHMAPTDLGAYRGLDDWLKQRPWLIGAAHTWSRRLFERFGPMLPGAIAEDQIMTFRAILSGGALSLREPLVRYRRGGLSRKRRYRSVAELVGRMRDGNHHALAESAQLQHDADLAGVGREVQAALAPKLAREQFVQHMFDAPGTAERLALCWRSRQVKRGLRVRILLYTVCPQVYAPVIWLKRMIRNR
ncbi:glycosyltransferase [Paraburkholderia bonniea]|uniref:glycosyltransferase family 2 protein n=1 Tax=Paraburkholderia bonniea TaxID=2152891 RepID=UPI001290E5D9|nr:glycosyltransferase [Paraburkholderia bonniea]WJF91637.1 glycosyltransferase [Paraburkholderia bonniea]WJF94956.1 glycosyltransferase [Paraburkholderia bonniea]